MFPPTPKFTASNRNHDFLWHGHGSGLSWHPPDCESAFMLWNITLIQVACKQTECASFCFNLMNLIVLAFLDSHCSFSGFSRVGRSVRGNNPPKLQHKDRERAREMEREADYRLKPNWHKQTTSKWRLLFIWWREKRGGKKREKILSDMQLSGEHFHMQNSERVREIT